MRLVTEGCEMCSFFAARLKLPSCTTARKVSSSASSKRMSGAALSRASPSGRLFTVVLSPTYLQCL
jgi:hypothetical protein